jgi:DNA replication protein DnaC
VTSESSLPLLLKQLALPSFYQHYQQQTAIAQDKHWSYEQYLASLSELEVANRYQKRIVRHVKESKLPPGKTIDSFDFSAAPSVNGAHIEALCSNTDWVRQAQNLILFGPSGVGKTHIAAAIGYRMIEQGLRVLYSSTSAMVQRLQRAKAEYKLSDAIAKLSRIPLLILEDISYVRKTEVETSVLFELIADRYETGSIIISSNQPFEDWDNVFPDSTMAVAAIDRLVHHATIINIQEKSFRKAHALKH